MTLDINTLKKSLLDIQLDPPSTSDAAAKRWATSYFEYTSVATAGSMIPIGQSVSLIEQSIKASLNSNFFDALSIGIISYWTQTSWASPGFIGLISNPGLPKPFLISASERNKNEISGELSASNIAAALHQYTKTILIVMTNVSSGITSVVSLS